MRRFGGLAAGMAALAWMTLSSGGVMARGAVCPSVTIVLATGLSFNRPGGTGLIRVFAPIPDCTWTATSSAPWVTFPDGATGAGSAWLRYLVAAAPPSADNRTATVTISGGNDATYQVFQSGRITGDTGWMQSPVGWNASPSTAAIAQPFVVSGYAIDDRAPSGTGVSSVQIFYVGNTGFHPVGTALYGASRPHIGETHGSQFENSGYELTVTGIPPLGPAPAASYSIQAVAVSSVDGSQLGAGAT
ncbi:MAG: BACON domain-containing protein, partial [Acidobacteria bacterium]|nr:BACON domain-containing protein [Acidobacteriota bacterium]